MTCDLYYNYSSRAAADSRPTQFDDRRAQILADLQNEPPQPNPSSAPPNNNANGGGGGNGAGADIFVQIPEARQMVETLLRYLPYVLILAVKYMIDHMDGILNVALLVIMFSHANWQVKKQIGRQKQRSLFALWRELAYVSVVLLFVCMLIGEWSWYQWWFGATQSDGAGGGGGDAMTAGGGGGGGGGVGGAGGGGAEWPLRRLLYNVLLTDMVAKLVTVHAKICVTLLPPYVINYRNRVSGESTMAGGVTSQHVSERSRTRRIVAVFCANRVASICSWRACRSWCAACCRCCRGWSTC